jgi:hypothetical protein
MPGRIGVKTNRPMPIAAAIPIMPAKAILAADSDSTFMTE